MDNLLILGRASDPPARALRLLRRSGEWRWAYRGFPRAIRIVQAIGTRARRLDVGEKVCKVGREAAHDLVESLALLRGEDEALDWWTDSLSERNLYLCPLIRECAFLGVVEKWLGEQGPVLLFIERGALRVVVARVAFDRGCGDPYQSCDGQICRDSLYGFSRVNGFFAEWYCGFCESCCRVQKVPFLDSAALSLAYVASGRADAYMERDIKIWDVAAGAALVKAAEGTIVLTRKTRVRPRHSD